MRRALLLVRSLPRGGTARRLLVLLFVGGLGVLGVRMLAHGTARPARPAGSGPGPEAVTPTGLTGEFSQMRPRRGDHMTSPRIGFRWRFAPGGTEGAASQASMVPPLLARRDSSGSDSGAVRFTFHLVGPAGSPEITRESRRETLRLTLEDGFPTGECEWWVEASIAGGPSIASPREGFTLTQ